MKSKSPTIKMLQLPFREDDDRQKGMVISNLSGIKNEVLVYFDTEDLVNKSISDARLLLEVYRCFESNIGSPRIKYTPNPNPLSEKLINAMEQAYDPVITKSTQHGFYEVNLTYAINLFTSGATPNYGIILTCDEGQARFSLGKRSKLLIQFAPGVIIPGATKEADSGDSDRIFYEKEFVLSSGSKPRYSPVIAGYNSRVISFFFENVGDVPAICFLQSSPDSVAYAAEGEKITVQPGELGRISPNTFSKFLRVAVQSETEETALVKVWFQTQVFTGK